MSLVRLVSSKVQAAEGLQDQYRKLYYSFDPTRLSGFSYHTLGHGNNGSDVTLWQVPARPTDQRGLTYTFAYVASGVQCIAAQVSVGASAIIECIHSENDRVNF